MADIDMEKRDLAATIHESRKDTDRVLSPEDFEFSPREQRNIINQLDRRLTVVLGIMYCISLMDRTNLAAAHIAGMQTDLQLSGNQYQIISLVFFISYIIFEPPSTIIVRAIGPRIHLSTIMFLWGGVMIGMGFVQQWQQLAILRVALGLFEAGFFPAAVYLMSTWYTRFEVGKRYSVFYVIGCVAAAFSGILAFGLNHMNGLGRLEGWRWIFIIEGIITCVVAFWAYWMLIDFPDSKRVSWSFLREKERAWVVARVHADRGDTHTLPFTWVRFLKPLLDFKIWGYAAIFFCTSSMAYCFAFYLPEILRHNMGFSIGASQCLVAPPYAFAGVVMFAGGWVGDNYRIRGPVIIFNMLLCLTGLSITGFHPDPNMRYFGIFFTAAGAMSNIPATMAFQANNIRGQWKRAISSATLVGFGGLGGIAGSLIISYEDRPLYSNATLLCLIAAASNIVIVILLDWASYVQNQRADRGETRLEVEDEEIEGDDFRYTY